MSDTPKVKVSIPEFEIEFEVEDSGDVREIAVRAAKYYWYRRNGWDVDWPIEMKIKGKVVSVDVEPIPSFDVFKVEEET